MWRWWWSVVGASATRGPISSLQGTDRAALVDAVTKAAGIHVGREAAVPSLRTTSDGPSPWEQSRTVLAVTFNSGYLDFFENWACYAVRAGLKFLTWPAERQAFERLRDDARWHPLWEKHGVLYFAADVAKALGIRHEASQFRQDGFDRVANFKLVMAAAILDVGFDVWVSDVDIAFKADPWPIVTEIIDGLNCSYIFQPNGPFEYVYQKVREANTGFHFLKAGDAALDNVLDLSVRDERRKRTEDQEHWWYVINTLVPRVTVSRNATGPLRHYWRKDVLNRPAIEHYTLYSNTTLPPLYLCPLPHDAFPCGWPSIQNSEVALGDRAAIVHANMVAGHAAKMSKLKSYHMWYPRQKKNDDPAAAPLACAGLF
ncbi:hypothetical protein CTAYLR_008378 [Chrysophaeum taylorii]|uniref:Nucleotide-diphospho-sugar transferase domain-containing protein n=1 Tax=Chrysophaeum taylorii TaxID=2483200 RepID=A0AAD7UHF8_9STRA|nr:hypothetical protein CTAYLR_008378 [Chrysophaeum taylorii]